MRIALFALLLAGCAQPPAEEPRLPLGMNCGEKGVYTIVRCEDENASCYMGQYGISCVPKPRTLSLTGGGNVDDH